MPLVSSKSLQSGQVIEMDSLLGDEIDSGDAIVLNDEEVQGRGEEHQVTIAVS